MNDKRLVFGSEEANEIIRKQKNQNKINEIKRLVNSAISKIYEASELATSVSVSVDDIKLVAKSIWELVNVTNTLMIDMGMENPISDTIENAVGIMDSLTYIIESAKEYLDNNDKESSLESLELPNETKQVQTSLESLLDKFAY